MKKQTKVLVAAAMLTLGASFSSMAALKNGTWVYNEEGWQYLDKEGEYVEEEWCMSNGQEFWINEDGVLGASEWVTVDDYTYYVQSDGSKAVNAWKYLYAEDDDDAEEESWFYFDSKGRMKKNTTEKIDGKNYYFDAEGKMITGWVEIHVNDDNKKDYSAADDKSLRSEVVYCNEDGARISSDWINIHPWTKEADEWYEDEYEWYYAGSNGKLTTGKKSSINGLSYIFDSETAQMVTGWAAKFNNGTYASIDGKAIDNATMAEIYFCDEDYGYLKKDSWRELDDPKAGDTYWYHFDKLGRAFIATTSDAEAVINTYEVEFTNGEKNTLTVSEDVVKVNELKVGSVYYYFNEKGEMIDGLQMIGDKLMYLEGGARQTGKVTLTDENENDYTFCFADETDSSELYEKYVAIEGNMDGYCYKQGQLMTSEESGVYELIVTNNGKFIVDYRGKIQHKADKEYEGVTGTYKFNENLKGAKEDSVIE